MTLLAKQSHRLLVSTTMPAIACTLRSSCLPQAPTAWRTNRFDPLTRVLLLDTRSASPEDQSFDRPNLVSCSQVSYKFPALASGRGEVGRERRGRLAYHQKPLHDRRPACPARGGHGVPGNRLSLPRNSGSRFCPAGITRIAEVHRHHAGKARD